MVLPPELRDQGLYDASSCHLGGLYEPLMIDGRTTGALAVMRAALWAMPETPNPLAVTLGVAGLPGWRPLPGSR